MDCLPLVTKQTFQFEPSIQVESFVKVEGPWFSRPEVELSRSMSYPGGNRSGIASLNCPRILVEDQIHIDDATSCISIVIPHGQILHNIDPGSIHKAEIDLTLLQERSADGSVNHQLCFLFINPSPHQPVPFNIDACLTKDKHDYVNRLQETPERAYHKLLLRHCLVPGYQVWPDVFTLTEAAAFARVAKSTMATWVKDGWVKASPGTKPRILRRNLEAYLESR